MHSTAVRRPLRSTIALLVSALVGAGMLVAAPAVAAPGDEDLAPGRATAASSALDGTASANAVDGDPTTLWASVSDNNEYLAVDLGGLADVTAITVTWGEEYAPNYDVSVKGQTWFEEDSYLGPGGTSDGGTERLEFSFPARARFVIIHPFGTRPDDGSGSPQRAGYQIAELQVHGTWRPPRVDFDYGALSGQAGDEIAVPVRLNNPVGSEQTVRVRSGGGTAEAGVDFTAVDETLTFRPGETVRTVTVDTVDRGAVAPTVSTVLTLSDPSSGMVLGAPVRSVVSITPPTDPADAGPPLVIEDFENGVPSYLGTFANPRQYLPTLSSVPDASVPGSTAGNDVLAVTVPARENDFAAPFPGDVVQLTASPDVQDWAGTDGFSFWFLGHGDGDTFNVRLGGFGQAVVDDTTGWRLVRLPFSGFRVAGDPADPALLDPATVQGFLLQLDGLGTGTVAFDDFSVYRTAVTLEDFEGEVPIGSAEDPMGFFAEGSPDASVTLGIEERERAGAADNLALAGTYEIPTGGSGGFSNTLETPQRWNGFAGLRFWWYASPDGSDDIEVVLKDGGPDAEHSELWSTTFEDTGSATSRWRLVELPFSSFALADDQPGGDETRNGTLDLTSARGFALAFPTGTGVTGWAVDDVQLYGTAVAPPTLTVTADRDVYLIEPGETADIVLTLTTDSGEPLENDARISVAPGGGNAPDIWPPDFARFQQVIVFPAGSPSGTTRTFPVVSNALGPDIARSVVIDISGPGVRRQELAPVVTKNAYGLPYLDEALPVTQRVDDLIARMSLAEKVGQMTQAERLGLASPAQIAEFGLGSILSGGGSVPEQNTPAGWADMVDGFQRQALTTPLQVPLLYGADAVHGHNNLVGATIFPHNVGLGATRDPALAQRIAETTAEETRATGVNWAFAPCLCVSRDERWGRAYESFGEDPALVELFASGAIVGLQGADPADKSAANEVLATAKHWAGDGGTAYDASRLEAGEYPIDQGLTTADSLEEFARLHIDPYLPAIAAGVGAMMPSYSGVDLGDGDVRMHENTLLNTDVLKGDLGFDGFLVSDWEGIDKLPGGTYAEKAARSVNSGLDMAMAPYNFTDFVEAVEAGVEGGAIDQARVDDAVRRILTQKFELGLFENPFTDRTNAAGIGSPEHRAVARQAVAKSQVLLKNDGVLPLSKDASLYVAGSNASDLGNQSGGWTISWQGSSGAITTGTTIAQGIAEVAPSARLTVSPDATAPLAGHDAGVVVVGETPYAEGIGDVGNNGHSLSLTDADRAAIDAVCGAMPCVVLVVAGRPQLVTDELASIDALVASFLPGSEGAGVADVLFGNRLFTGRLPLTWPATAGQVPINVGDAAYEPLYSFGWGERTDAARDRVSQVLAGLAPGAARDAVAALLDADVWAADGSIADAEAALPLIVAAVALVPDDLLVSLARDLAQAAITAGTAADGAHALAADAEHLLLTGDASGAVDLLASILDVSPVDPGPGTGPGPGPDPRPVPSGGSLAPTGADAAPVLLVALALLAVGALLRRRRLTLTQRQPLPSKPWTGRSPT